MKPSIKLFSIICVTILFIACGRHYEVPINITIHLPDCNTEECLRELEKINFEKLVNIEVKAEVEKETEVGADLGINPF